MKPIPAILFTMLCHHCRKEVKVERRISRVDECPHCGYEIRNPRPVPLAETMVVAEPSDLHADVPRPPSASQPDVDPLVGTDLGIYRIDALLGKGGMGRPALSKFPLLEAWPAFHEGRMTAGPRQHHPAAARKVRFFVPLGPGP